MCDGLREAHRIADSIVDDLEDCPIGMMAIQLAAAKMILRSSPDPQHIEAAIEIFTAGLPNLCANGLRAGAASEGHRTH